VSSRWPSSSHEHDKFASHLYRSRWNIGQPANGQASGKQIERMSHLDVQAAEALASRAICGSGRNSCELAIENCAPMQKSAVTLIFRRAAK
jgi:hypothetical protein